MSKLFQFNCPYCSKRYETYYIPAHNIWCECRKTFNPSQVQATPDKSVDNFSETFNKKQLNLVVQLATGLGWNGVDNSKILSEFLAQYISSLHAEIHALKRKFKLQFGLIDQQINAEEEIWKDIRELLPGEDHPTFKHSVRLLLLDYRRLQREAKNGKQARK